jgi:hypothetical protein
MLTREVVDVTSDPKRVLPRGPGKVRVDIERLLRWTYRDELPKSRDRGDGVRAQISPMFKWAELGGRVDDWSRDPGFPAIFGEPHPDAVRVQLFVSRLDDMEMDWPASRAALMGDLVALAPKTGPSTLSRLRTAALVTMHAAMGTRPDWEHEAPTCHRVIGSHGKIVVQRLDDDGRLTEGVDRSRNYGRAARCPLRWDPPPSDIAVTRAEYAAWHAGLVLLTGQLRGELDEHEPLAPAAPAEPWNDAGREGRVLWAGQGG